MNFSYQKTMADELREMAEASANTILNEFIKCFTATASTAANNGKREIRYNFSKKEASQVMKIGDWLEKNGFAYTAGTHQSEGSWFDIKW